MSWTDGGAPVVPPRNSLHFRTLARLAVSMRRNSRDGASEAPAGGDEAAQARERERARLLATDEEGAQTGLY
jgi:hypothetical protein